MKMEKFITLSSVAIPLMRVNVDTDAIIPSREMKGVSKKGLADGLFANWRYVDVDAREEDPSFILNKSHFRKAKILLSGENFGCGSSREHAVWALKEWGIRAIIAPSFGSIFFGNCIRNGVLPITMNGTLVDNFARISTDSLGQGVFNINLPKAEIMIPSGERYKFDLPISDKEMLVEGLDPIGVTIKKRDLINKFQEADRVSRPWVYI